MTKRNHKKLINIFVLSLLLLTLFSINVDSFDLDVKSAILVEAETGQILYEKNPDEKLPPASITKIMPMLLTMEKIETGEISLDDTFIISNHASSMGGSQIYLNENTEITIEELLKAVTVASANDATVALSEAVGGFYSSFIDLMNQRADELGMANTNFINSTGLPAEDHYTTARDIVKMSQEIVQYDKILDWGQIWVDYIELPNREAMLVNTNRLINMYPGVDGLKTGHTSEAGYCLTATAERNDIRLISVVLGAESDEERIELTRNLLNYGFGNFAPQIILGEGEFIHNIEVMDASDQFISGRAAADLQVMVKRGAGDLLESEFIARENLSAPINQDDVIGRQVVKEEDEIINSVDILAAEDVERANIFVRLWRSFVNWIGSILSNIFA